MVIALDTDVLTVRHVYRRDRRRTTNERFLQEGHAYGLGVTIYNLLELCGIAQPHGYSAREIFRHYTTSSTVTVLYPPVLLDSEEAYWRAHNEALLSRIERGMRLGDAVILWVTETCGCEALVTWNTRHFVGKTELPVLTPAEWLERF